VANSNRAPVIKESTGKTSSIQKFSALVLQMEKLIKTKSLKKEKC